MLQRQARAAGLAACAFRSTWHWWRLMPSSMFWWHDSSVMLHHRLHWPLYQPCCLGRHATQVQQGAATTCALAQRA